MERRRRLSAVLVMLFAFITGVIYEGIHYNQSQNSTQSPPTTSVLNGQLAEEVLKTLQVKGRAPKTDYKRVHFGEGWQELPGCDVRNYILKRDLTNVVTRSDSDCTVESGVLNDPYTDKVIKFTRGQNSSDDVQIDHVVALSDAWQKGAQSHGFDKRLAFANDSLNLLAVDGPTNMKKSDSDAATWLPANKDYRCRYVARQVAVKSKYQLWVTVAERDAIDRVLQTCPEQLLPIAQ